MPHRLPIPVPIALDGEAVASETLLTSHGADVLILSTCLPTRAIDFRSVYMGNGIAESHAHHWALAAGRADAWSHTHDAEVFPVRHARGRCLYDHLQALQQWLDDLGHASEIAALDEAIAALGG